MSRVEIQCRIDDCTHSDSYRTIGGLNDSGWSKVSKFSVCTPDGWALKGYCPAHDGEIGGGLMYV